MRTGRGETLAGFQFLETGTFGDEMSLTGRYFTGEGGLTANVINRFAAKATSMDVALTLAQATRAKSPVVRACRCPRASPVSRSLRERSCVSTDINAAVTYRKFREAALQFKEKRKLGGFKMRH